MIQQLFQLKGHPSKTSEMQDHRMRFHIPNRSRNHHILKLSPLFNHILRVHIQPPIRHIRKHNQCQYLVHKHRLYHSRQLQGLRPHSNRFHQLRQRKANSLRYYLVTQKMLQMKMIHYYSNNLNRMFLFMLLQQPPGAQRPNVPPNSQPQSAPPTAGAQPSQQPPSQPVRVFIYGAEQIKK